MSSDLHELIHSSSLYNGIANNDFGPFEEVTAPRSEKLMEIMEELAKGLNKTDKVMIFTQTRAGAAVTIEN